ncbi:DNA-directed RNA polymerase subunit omega [Anoxybacillus rupiensis]|jgi:DNA-directed RNA polymerase subunit omega|uniref:DNA-directed RNA polymerase subunit omega n=1 Tax=Anoxybacteroides rupiense TaxID=311460 RepID=A0ABD5IQF2_9BACL|nr:MULTISPECIES: DNA-directed RNA polymerase subunit omega [Anoxybacillus]KXG10495.1 DNA-directed RNA polymerase subunit omega [Anoxybacillus sp. P3H1B]MBB3906221.1 DNA-directed RNA polymerase subunit omega [Anoxybacillus rupiensis]MBS2770795.1 DNA-directed RNA polymerase subunit omega [Anoxybacillus rupiensis]MDE8563062.1 DNA-directed RNA polymerase subunit omega [Anoxybacillus rupiensis]MED5050423.1 DNA-directed RNA polymerase subunit omega [Anoxybacillus rupiensis]
MLYPSIDLLMEKLDSKYTLVSVAAKRARQLQEKDDLTIERPVSKKFVGKALEEIAAGHIELVKEE